MSNRIHFTSIILMIFSSLLFLGCQEKDDLYGNDPSEYRPTGGPSDKAAADYFRQKQISCFDQKSDFAQNMSSGWTDVGFLIADPDGNITATPTTSNNVARLGFSYENINNRDGLSMLIMLLANTSGYYNTSFLYKCNEKDTYFYIADYNNDGSALLNVLSFSISAQDLPKVNELAHTFGPFAPGSKVVGLTVRRGFKGSNVLSDKIGNVPTLAYHMRSSFCNRGDQLWTGNPSTQITKTCGGGNLQGVTLDKFIIYQPAPGTWYSGGFAIDLFTRGSSQVAARITEYPIPDRFNRKCTYRVFRAGRLVYTFTGYVSGIFSNTVTDVVINV